MKRKTGIILLGISIFLIGCGEKKGTSCESKVAINTLTSVVNKNTNKQYAIDENNIVIWDYNPVGRYMCKAKLKKVSDKNTNKTQIAPYISAVYGISDGGWVTYQTYETTAKDDRLYVEIIPIAQTKN